MSGREPLEQFLAFGEQVAKVAGARGVAIDPAVVAAVAAGLSRPGGSSMTGPQADSGIFNRLRTAARYLVTGVGPQNFFGPWQPIAPMADRPEQGVIGRLVDYMAGQNLQIPPRAPEAIDFPTLRAFATNYDLLALAIETCKDQVASFGWEIVPEDDKADPAAFQEEISRISSFLERPDKELDFDTWLGKFLDDNLILDAVAVYPRMDKKGELYALDLMDAGTIARIIDEYGRTPIPPDPAYRQVIKGIPAVFYTRDDLAYLVRRPRTWKLYGWGPIEQVIMTVNIALRRQQHQLEFYTEGSVPDALISVPDTWSSQQIKDFQGWFDTILSGQTGERRKVRFIPQASTVSYTKQNGLKDEYDEWLARIICWALSISPNALIKQMNRAAGEQIAETAKEEGQVPRLRWVAAQLNALLRQYLGMRGVKFAWKFAKEMDPLKAAQAAQIYVQQKVVTPDEVRTDLGKPALTEDQRASAWPAPPPPPALPNPAKPGEETAQPASGAAAQPPGGAEKRLGESLGKARRASTKRTAVEIAVARVEKSVAAAINAVFRRGAKSIAKTLSAAYARKGARKGATDDLIAALMQSVDEEEKQVAVDAVEAFSAEITAMFSQGGRTGLAKVGIDTSEAMTSHLDQAALAFAEKRGAELVTGIAETTRDYLQNLVSEAVETGASPKSLADAIEGSTAFSPERSMTIARTELAFAHVSGNLEGWKESGQVEGKEWLIASDACEECEPLNGVVVGLDEDFPDGAGDGPPKHPRCRCDILPVLTEGE